MTKKDLRDGMIIETRGFGPYLVMDNCTVARGIDGFITLTDQNEDLTYGLDEVFTIVKVYANDTGKFSLTNMFKHPGTLLWERPTVKEMTLEEIEKELGYKVKLVNPLVCTGKHNFKVGDKVRTTKLKDTAGTPLFPIGTVCTIEHIYTDGSCLPYKLKKENGDYFWYNADMFEPCDREFKVGDVVRIRQWKDMEDEFGVDIDGDIDCPHHFTTEMKHLCGRKCKVIGVDYDGDVTLDFGAYDDDTVWNYSIEMIEHV